MQKASKDTANYELINQFEAPLRPLDIEINCDNYQETDTKKLEMIEE
jgi:hypothetical protein